MKNPDFSGYATRNDIVCSDGRTIKRNAFVGCNGKTVPLVWNHDHKNQSAILGHAELENRDDGVYAFCKFNDTEEGQHAKKLVQHGDVRSLSIWANQLRQVGNDVIHGDIKELSLVWAGANPGAFVDFVMGHGDEGEDGVYASYDESIMLYHSDPDLKDPDKKPDSNSEKKPEDDKKEKTVQGIINTMSEEQQEVMQYLIGKALENNDDQKEEKEMSHNVFEKDKNSTNQRAVLSHSDEMAIIECAKRPGVGSLKEAIEAFKAENADTLAHGLFEDADIEALFPEYELLKKGEPDTLERDQSWVDYAINKIHKSPYSRVRTRNADARVAELRAKGYQKKGDYKKEGGKIKLLTRTTDPQTIFIKDDLNRDDITDITDFDPVAYQWRMMRHVLNEELAMAALVGDGRDDGDADKIHEDHIRPIWKDDDLYTIHKDVDIAAAKQKLQGTNTGANFGENYIYAEAIIEASLYAREDYKGSGTPDLICTPHLLNVMLLARDLNGRRIYNSKSDLAAALNVGEIHTAEQFAGLERTTSDGHTKKLLGLFVNLADYQFGATKGGEITKFDDFDIDFNKYKYLMETRISGALTKPYAAIALEEQVA